MTLAIEVNDLDVAAIHPSKGAKYSPNLYKWLTSRKRPDRAWSSRVYRDAEGTLWVGMLDLGDLFGARLIGVLCNGNSEGSACWVNLRGLVEVTDFWPRYMRDGRCAIDADHKQRFIGDDTRWTVSGDTRACLWCGCHVQKIRRWVEPVERSAWEPVKAEAAWK